MFVSIVDVLVVYGSPRLESQGYRMIDVFSKKSMILGRYG